jgi:hypothetical protein
LRALIATTALCASLCAGCARTPEDWRARLKDEDPFERGLAALALARTAPAESTDALPCLLQLVEGRDPALARAARDELARLARHHVHSLLENFAGVTGASPDFRSALRAALVAAGAEAVGPLREHLLDAGASNPRELGQILADIGQSAVAPLTADLADPDPRRRVCTAWILARLGRQAQSAAPALTELLAKDEALVARQAALTLAEIAPLDDATVATLERELARRGSELADPLREALARLALNRARLGIRLDLGRRLFALGAEAFVPAVEACAAEDPVLQALALRHLRLRYAALALGLDPGRPRAASTPERLQAELDDRDPGTRAQAALEIAGLGTRAADFLQPLASHTRDRHPGVAASAQLALLQLVRDFALESARRRP